MAGAASPGDGERSAGSKKNLYEVIRDQLIDEIESGRYPAGALLPSVRELTAKMAISTTTARKALAEVVTGGYARSEGTRGHVSEGPRAQAVEKASQTVEASPKEGFAGLVVRPSLVIAAGGTAAPETEGILVDVRTEQGPAEVALALSLEDATVPVVVRTRLALDSKGTPLELRTSYLTREFAQNTALASPDAIAESWASALAAHAKEPIGTTESQVTARHPTDSEAAMLRLRPTACVLIRMETTRIQSGRPLDHTVTIWPGETTRLNLEGR